MNELVIAYDLGTGGIKSSAVSANGEILCSTFIPYETFYSVEGYQEQRPDDWWNALVSATRQLLDMEVVRKEDIKAVAISGHSLGVVPIGKGG